MFNGDKGRLELEVAENTYRLPIKKGGDTAGVTHGEKALPGEGHQRITLHPMWEKPVEVPFVKGTGGHGELFAAFRLPCAPKQEGLGACS